MFYNNNIHITFDLSKEEAELLSKYALENQERLKQMGILAVHINDTNQTLSNDTVQVINNTKPNKSIVTQKHHQLQPQHQPIITNSIRRAPTSNHNTVKRLKQTIAKTTIANSLFSSSSQSPMSTNDSNQMQSPMKLNNNILLNNRQDQSQQQHQQQFSWPSPLLSNLLKSEASPIDITNKDTLTNMSEEYKQIYYLRESLVESSKSQQLNINENSNSNSSVKRITNNKRTITTPTAVLAPASSAPSIPLTATTSTVNQTKLVLLTNNEANFKGFNVN